MGGREGEVQLPQLQQPPAGPGRGGSRHRPHRQDGDTDPGYRRAGQRPGGTLEPAGAEDADSDEAPQERPPV